MRTLAKALFALALFFSYMGVAVCQDVAPAIPLDGEIAKLLPVSIGGYFGMALPFAMAALMFLNGLSSMLLWVKDKTKTDLDNRAFTLISSLADWLAHAIGGFTTMAVPKAVILAKAEKIKASDAK